MEVSTEEIVYQAYRLIRQKSRDVVDPVGNEELGSYVRGVVDLQTSLYSLEAIKQGQTSLYGLEEFKQKENKGGK